MEFESKALLPKMKLMVDFIGRVNSLIDEKSLLREILKVAMDLVDSAEYGIIFHKGKVLVSEGYKRVENWMYEANECGIIKADREWSENLEKSYGIILKSSLLCPIKGKKTEFLLKLDVSDKNPRDFSKEDLEIMKMYSKLLANVIKFRETNEILLTRGEMYESIVEKSHDAIFVFKDGKLLFVNKKAMSLTGYSIDELIGGLDAWNMIHPQDREKLKRIYAKRKLSQEAPHEYKVRLLTKTGTIRLCDFNVKEIRFRGMEALLGSVKDITQEEKTKEELKLANSEVKSAYKELGKLNVRFQNMTELLAKMGISNVSEEEFLKEVLNSALQVVPVAKYGSVSIFNGEKWRFVAAVGHDMNKLKELTLKKAYALTSGNRLIDYIVERDEKIISAEKLSDFLSYTLPVKQTVVAPFDLSGKVEGFLALDIPKNSEESFSPEDAKAVESFAKIASAFYILRKYSRAQEEMKEKITLVLVKALEKYDPYTQGHSQRVARCSAVLARKIGLNEEKARKIYQEAILHDIGKLFVPLSILNKEGKLTHEEFEEIKKHPVIGAELVKEGAELSEMALVIKHHHEWWNGKGYPSGLVGEEIPLDSRIMSICDAYDAMTSDRSYRKAKSEREALREIEKNSGKQFDPKLVKVFLKMKRE